MSSFAIFSQLKRKECAITLLQNKIANFLSFKGSVQVSSHFLVVPNAIYVVGEYFLPKLEICSKFFPARKLTIHMCQGPNAPQNKKPDISNCPHFCCDLEKGCSVSRKCNMYQRICVDMEGVVLDLRASSPRIRQKWVLEVERGGFL